jgi:hypothetical protein
MASVLMEKSETITLDLCTSILPVVTDLLESKTDRYFLLQSLQMIMIVAGILVKQSVLTPNLCRFIYVLCHPDILVIKCTQTLSCFIGVVSEAYQDFWASNTLNSISWPIVCWCRSSGRGKVLFSAMTSPIGSY